MPAKTLDQRIVQTHGICGWKPRIDGHRITVQNIAIWHDRLGWSVDKIADEFDIDIADIYVAMAYYFSHRKKLDCSIKESKIFAEKLRDQIPSLLVQKLTIKSLMPSFRFYFDKHIASAIVKGVRRCGVDVLTLVEAGKLGITDKEHFVFARQQERVIVTPDTDFLHLAASSSDHAGIIYGPQHCRKFGSCGRIAKFL